MAVIDVKGANGYGVNREWDCIISMCLLLGR